MRFSMQSGNPIRTIESGTYKSLFQFVRKNTALPDKINAVSCQQNELFALLTAIQHGDHEAKIFKHPDCIYFILNLMKTDQISYTQGINTYQYLIALSEFSQYQPLLNDKGMIKSDRHLKKENLFNDDGSITSVGECYVSHIIQSLSYLYPIYINHKMVISALKKLPKTEQHLLAIEYSYIDDENINYNELSIRFNYNTGLDTLLSAFKDGNVYSLNITIPDSQGRILYVLPTFGLFQITQQLIHSDAMQLLPVFGKISEQTLLELHRKGLHPFPLYNPLIRSNYEEVHDSITSPTAMMVHDMFHAASANLFTPAHRHLILYEIISDLLILKDLVKLDDDYETLDKMIHHLNDFELMEHREQKKELKRFFSFIEFSNTLTVQNQPDNGVELYSAYVRIKYNRRGIYDLTQIISFDKETFGHMPEIKSLIEKHKGDLSLIRDEINKDIVISSTANHPFSFFSRLSDNKNIPAGPTLLPSPNL